MQLKRDTHGAKAARHPPPSLDERKRIRRIQKEKKTARRGDDSEKVEARAKREKGKGGLEYEDTIS